MVLTVCVSQGDNPIIPLIFSAPDCLDCPRNFFRNLLPMTEVCHLLRRKAANALSNRREWCLVKLLLPKLLARPYLRARKLLKVCPPYLPRLFRKLQGRARTPGQKFHQHSQHEFYETWFTYD
jgi:hypothetical protein